MVLLLFISLSLSLSNCTGKDNKGDNNTPPVTNEMDWWLTRGDQSSLLEKQPGAFAFGTTANASPSITIDTTQRFQTIDGFGYTLTGGSAVLINAMSAPAKTALLDELFSNNDNSIHISYLRISIGASDLNPSVFTYDDKPAGQTDPTLASFSLDPDRAGGTGLIPLMKQILAIRPDIKILATPWTAPVWMKDNGNSVGGSLQPTFYSVYAQYFVKYIQQMKTEGITIDAITPQNEPQHDGNNPSMLMTAAQQADFIKNHLGPAFQSAGIATKIIVYDHNCDHPDYPLNVLNDAAARVFVDGSAFHLYAGDIISLSTVHNAFPNKNVYFTEQYTGKNGTFDGDLKWHMKNVIIGSMRNWSRIALEWNLANDPNFGPYTPGGCNTCKGAVTIGSSVARNVAYYIIAHASKFVPPGSVRIGSNDIAGIANVAFQTPSGKKILIALNENVSANSFNIKFRDKWIPITLAGGAVATFTW